MQSDTLQHLSLLFAGDLMQHQPQVDYALRPDSSYSYAGYYDAIRPIVESVDVAFANLEVTVSGQKPSGYPVFSVPDAYLYAVRDAGFDVLFTANNHCCDKGKRGLMRTLQMCDSLGIPHMGAYRDSTERSLQHPFLLERNGFRIAMLNYSYGTNGLSVPKPMVVNLIDTVQMRIDIERAKAMKPDLIIVIPHWGIEYENLPRPHMVRLANWFFRQGVDYVVGGHPHVVQPVELRADSITGQQHLVAYSLGNLVSDQSKLPKYGGMMLRLELEKSEGGRPHLSRCGYYLTFVSRPQWSRHDNYRVYPVTIADSLLNWKERERLGAFLGLARPLFRDHNIGVTELTSP